MTVPAYFNSCQKQATKDACAIAGLDCVRVIQEPTAASVAYGLHRQDNIADTIEEKCILVYDIGGGTLDVSILSMSEGLVDVAGTSGDAYLGGRDFDEALVDYLNAEFHRQHSRNLREPQYHAAYQRLRRVAEQVKIELSNQEAVPINARNILGAMGLNMSLTRERF